MKPFDLQSFNARIRRIWSSRADVVGGLAHWSGAGWAFEAVARPDGAIILMYHSVATTEEARFIDPPNRITPECFEQQMKFLSEHRRVMSMSDLMERLERGESPPAGTVCITLDDGYLDNLTVAAPILQKYRLPATLYLATGYVERGETQWADVLYWMFERRTRHSLSMGGVASGSLDIAIPAQRAAARRILHKHLLESTPEARGALLEEAIGHLRPGGEMPRLTLTWAEVRELRRRNPLIELAGHTRNHVDLRKHSGSLAEREISGCRDDLRRELGASPSHFSFPYERWCEESRKLVIEAGWRSAVGVGKNFRIGAHSDRFSMPRVESPRSITELAFKTSGAYPGLLATIGLA